MASILDRYGIKEVADVTFYDINPDGTPGKPVLYLDTLKVSTIEQTAEETFAQGGKGNVNLIGWDFNKEITVNLEDALFSAKSMALMFGDGRVNEDPVKILKTMEFVASEAGAAGTIKNWTDANGKTHEIADPTYYLPNGEPMSDVTSVKKGEKYLVKFEYDAVNPGTITISSGAFPSTYYVTGDTFARSQTTGKDEYFQFIVPKAKLTSENTITLEAAGDPSVFNMSLKVLRPDDGNMMKLVKYDVGE